MESDYSILSTAYIDESSSIDAYMGVSIDTIPFIETKISDYQSLHKNINPLISQHIIAIFTSVNAVKALSQFKEIEKAQWQICCTRSATKNAAEKLLSNSTIIATANDAEELSKVILELKMSEVYFFSGNIRSSILPDTLSNNGIIVNEINCYDTNTIKHSISKIYNGYLFFSPSAAHAFFSLNNIPLSAYAFAIGNSTKKALLNYLAENQIITSKEANKKEVLETAIQFLKH